jgi:hypothetical protein
MPYAATNPVATDKPNITKAVKGVSASTACNFAQSQAVMGTAGNSVKNTMCPNIDPSTQRKIASTDPNSRFAPDVFTAGRLTADNLR